VTTLDERPVAHDVGLAAQRGEMRAAARREQDAYDFGYHDGYEAGLREAHTQIAEWWARLAATVQADANRLKGTVPAPAQRSNGSSDDSIWFTAAEWAHWAGAQ